MASTRILYLYFQYVLCFLIQLHQRSAYGRSIDRSRYYDFKIPVCNCSLRLDQSKRALAYIKEANASLNVASAKAMKFPNISSLIDHARVQASKVEQFIEANDYSHGRNVCGYMAMDIRNCMRILSTMYNASDWEEFGYANQTTSISLNLLTSLSIRCQSPDSSKCSLEVTNPPPVQPKVLGKDTWVLESLLYSDRVSYTSDNTINLSFTDGKGSRIRTVKSFSSGRFSLLFKCPKNASGLVSEITLSRGGLRNVSSPVIQYYFVGSDPTRFYTAVGYGGNSSVSMIDMDFDCAQDFHKYSIEWTPTIIRWWVDGQLVREFKGDAHVQSVPICMFNLFVGVSTPFELREGWLNHAFEPFVASVKAFNVIAPMLSQLMLPYPKVPVEPFPMKTIAIDYCNKFIKRNGGDISIFWDNKAYCGGRFRSVKKYPQGRFTTLFKCAQGNVSGLLGSFYLSSQEGNRHQDEIDFEFLGKSKFYVQTNYWVDGRGGNERMIYLGFDCSQDYHNYTIVWKPTSLIWYIDSVPVRILINDRITPYPIKESYLYASVWNASDSPHWVGWWSGVDSPYEYKYRSIEIQAEFAN